MKNLFTVLVPVLSLLQGVADFARADFSAEANGDFFEKKVRPLLVERCYECHSGEQKIKGGLRLDSREGWSVGGDSGPAALPGDPDKSLLVEAIRYANRDMQMPPKQKLPPAEIEILEQWIRMGAPDPRTETPTAKKQKGLSVEEGRKFWCYAPLQKPQIPEARLPSWSASAIDRFILTSLDKAGITPAQQAELPALARRLYFNLVGLPPSPAQLDSFLADATMDRKTAVEKLVDALLASPQFGETWGRHWLDITRFAESSGGGRTLLFKDAWRYRDYVLESVNADTPLNRFIIEQIAGDLLPADSPIEQRRLITATAFLALGPTNYEEQEKQQLRFDIVDEQLDTIGRAFLGQTVGCARCHDHKFDPIPQADYYAMAGILSSTRTLLNYTDNVARWISTPLPSIGHEAEDALKLHEKRLADLKTQLTAAQTALGESTKALSASTTAPGMALDPRTLPGLVLDDTEAKTVGEWRHTAFVRTFIGKGYLSDDNKDKGQKTVTFTPAVPDTGKYEVRLAYSQNANRAKNVRVNILHADGEDTVYVDETLPPPIEGRFISLGKFKFEKDGAGYVLISNEATLGYVVVDALQLLPEAAAQAPSPQVETPARKPTGPAKHKPAPESAESRAVRELEAKLKTLLKEGPVRETAMAVHDDVEVGDTQLRIRGIERQRGTVVPRGFMQVALSTPVQPLPKNASGRKELAQWIASDDNPLTARVLANRVWHWLFGAGIVPSVDNFGTTGDAPSHPELLDYLAGRLIAEGWSLKKLVREIVLSQTWQLSVQPNAASDPDNRLFSHANRRRLSAEQLRDAVLLISGKLDTRFGGQNITGAGDIDANSNAAQNIEYGYVYNDVRRSVYTPAFRNKRLELFEVFDFANISQPIGQRTQSNVAPQALFLLNSPFIYNAATEAAATSLAAPSSDTARLESAYRSTLGRGPSAAEAELCMKFLRSAKTPAEGWAQLHQMLFACVDFRYLD